MLASTTRGKFWSVLIELQLLSQDAYCLRFENFQRLENALPHIRQIYVKHLEQCREMRDDRELVIKRCMPLVGWLVSNRLWSIAVIA